MNNIGDDFNLFARSNCRVSSNTLDSYKYIFNSCVNPTILEERKLNVAQMDIFSRLLYDNIIFLGSEINDEVSNIIQAQLLYLSNNNPTTDINLYINSPGGSVISGLGIYDTMQLVQPDVVTLCTGSALSMGAVLLSAGAAGKRRILPHARVMIHQPSCGCPRSQESDIDIMAKETKKLKVELYEILAQHTGQSINKITKDADRDHWFTASEALNYGLVDEILVKHNNGTNKGTTEK